MQIERGQRLAAAQNRRGSVHAFDQRFQLRLHFENDAGAAGGDQRGVARKLNGIAETLLGMEQDGLAVDRPLSAPLRLDKIAPQAGNVFSPPAPFVFRQAGGKIAHAQQGQRLVDVDVGAIRPQREGAPVAGERFVVAAQLAQRIAALVKRIEVRGIECDRAVEAAQRVDMAPEFHQRPTAVMQRRDITRLEDERAIEHGQRIRTAAHGVEGGAVVRRRFAGGPVDLGHSGEQFERLDVLRALVTDHPELIEGVFFVGPNRQDLAISHFRFACVPLGLQPGRRQDVGRNRLAVLGLRFGHGAEGLKHSAVQIIADGGAQSTCPRRSQPRAGVRRRRAVKIHIVVKKRVVPS